MLSQYAPNVMGSGFKTRIMSASSFKLSTLAQPEALQAGCERVKVQQKTTTTTTTTTKTTTTESVLKSGWWKCRWVQQDQRYFHVSRSPSGPDGPNTAM